MRTRSVLLLCVLLGLLAAPRAVAQQPSDFTFALTGDSIITRKLTVYNEPAFIRIIDLVRSADVAFTNLEMLFHDYEPYAIGCQRRHLHARGAGAREGSRLGRLRHGGAREQSHRRLRRARA